MTFQPINLSDLPSRNRGPKVNLDEARALLDIVQKHGAASDRESYEDAEKARTAGMKAVRLLSHVVPTGKRAAVRTFPMEKNGKPNGFGYAVHLKDAKASATEAPATAESE